MKKVSLSKRTTKHVRGAESVSKSNRSSKSRSSSSVEQPSRSPAEAVGEFPIVGIGASAGGLEALSELLQHVPEKTGMAFVAVQHLDPTHGSMLQEILSRTTKMPVMEVTDRVKVEPDHLYVIPANTNMVIQDGVLRLGARTLTRGIHMPVDQFFSSLAAQRGSRAIGVILSGTASDGTEGCRAVKAAGGITFAQTEDSAKYRSMPHSAIASGCIDFVLEPKAIAKELTRIGRHPYVMGAALPKHEETSVAAGSDLEKLLRQLRAATGVDFSFYKQTTLQRRIKRRIVVHHLANMKEYLRYVESNPAELDELYRDILIHVTGFFRDKEAFEALRNEVFPSLVKNRKLDESPIRIWVPGCSTGEEVYSIAISLLEFLWESARKESWGVVANKALQIFATDISETALDVARAGLYTESAVADVSPERLARFFIKIDGGYQINKSIRDMCIFARQDVTRDPPFSNLDLVSCRNLLIYLGPVLQKRVVPIFHYALKPNGFLMLGGSESLGPFTDHFNLIDKKYKIYRKKEGAARLITLFTGGEYIPHRLEQPRSQPSRTTPLPVDKEVERILLSRFSPPAVIVNKDMEIVHFRGRTGAYLEPAAGQPTFSLSKMAREGLSVELRAAISKAKKENTAVRAEGVQVRSNGTVAEVNLEVVPIQAQDSHERLYLVVFENVLSRPAAQKPGKGAEPKSGATAPEVERLRRDLAQVREQFQSLIEDHETTVEEYRSANEEVLSANEELQSTNEELETAKEELQSSNEELTTLNEELQNRNIELAQTNNDLVNLLANVNMPIIMIGNDLRIRRFTPPAQLLLNLIPADLGRRLGDLKPNLEVDDLEHVVRETVYGAVLREQEVKQKNGPWYLMRVRPYKTWDNKIDGAVISFQDIDTFKKKVRETTSLVDALIESARESVLILDQNLLVTVANPAFYRTFQVSREETEGHFLYELGNRQWDINTLRKQLRRVTEENTRIDNFEVKHDFLKIGARTVLLNARAIELNPGQKLILLSIEDVTEQGRQLEELKRQATMLDMARDSVILRDMQGKIISWNRGAEEMYGWKRDEAVARNSSELLHTVFPKPFKEVQADLQKTGHWEGELVHKRRDGQEIVVSSRWALLQQDGGLPIALEINTDITQRKRSEDSLRRLSGYLMRVQDEERRRIARELHDSTGQKLVALKMNLDMLAKNDAKSGNNKKMVRESVKLVEEAAREIRTLAQLLHPPLLDEAGLISATRWLVEGFSTRAGITVDLAVDPKIGRLPQNVEVALFRIIQESLNNIHRHSGAKKARIELRHSDGEVKLKITDDGKGFSGEVRGNGGDDAEKPLPGVGILGMKERLAQLGGTLTINSTREGTTIEAVVGNREQKASA